jgi:hypothetical protein
VREVTNHLAARQRALTEEAVALVGSITNRARTAETWRDAVARIGTRLLTIQVALAGLADQYLTDVLEAQNASAAADGAINPGAWQDYTDGGGSLLLNLVYSVAAVPRAGVASDLLERQVSDLASSIVLTGLQDTGRSSVQASMQTRPSAGAYVRMLNAPSCARCVLLAGRVYHRATAFRRHLRCDCRNVPTPEDVADDWTTNPATYFRSLSHAEQDRTFTAAGAEAIRLGGVKQVAINQIVNARAGISTVTAYGRELQVTTTGTTKRAVFGGYEVLEDGTLRRRTEFERRRGKTGIRTFQYATTPRLLPDEIFQLSEEFGWDRAETLRQLRRYAYVL